jgi:hypothetical protein
MAGEYIINFSDGLIPTFTINANTIDNTSTPLVLPGRFTVNYGEILAEDLVHLLENFSSSAEPANPISGMLWFDSSTNTLKIRTTGGSWEGVGGGGAGKAPTGVVAAAFTAIAGENYFINSTSSAITVTLPSSPSVGDIITFTDVAGTFDTNQLTVARASAAASDNIMGSASDMTNNVQFSSFRLAYSGAAFAWRIIA